MRSKRLTVIGGGIGGLTTAICAAEQGVDVTLYERRRRLGGLAWTTAGDFKANWGPHVIYRDGPWWRWLVERGLAKPAHGLPKLPTTRFRYDGRSHRFPPRTTLGALFRLRGADAPVDRSFVDWAEGLVGLREARRLANFVGVTTYDHDPGRLSATFVNERLRRATSPRARVACFPGGWATLVARLAERARRLGVTVHLNATVEELPSGPVVVATPMPVAAQLLGEPGLVATGTRVALLDVGLRQRRAPFIVSDLDEPGWVETFSRADPELAPPGCHLLQAQKGLRPNETLAEGVGRITALLDAAVPGWSTSVEWSRQMAVEDETGALDVPGRTWRDRPAVDRGGDRYLVNDMVAAPGLLTEVSFNAAVAAAEGVTTAATTSSRTTGATVAAFAAVSRTLLSDRR